MAAFIQEEELVQRVLMLIQNQSMVIKSEALYVIVNAIQCGGVDCRMQLFTKFK